ncbi:MAG: hypothetical protein LBC82_02000 [Oscillospiraceae bacterium]|jgi:hypothetical protein|nr:hypothetical protein [Oscillospiraceae bacterium]
MSYDTKLIIGLIAQNVAKAKSVKEAYNSIRAAACVEGMNLPTYEEAVEGFETTP